MHTVPRLRRFIRRRLINVGVKPSHALVISEAFQRQVDNRGLAGATDYLKRVGDQLIVHLKKGGRVNPWISYIRGNFPKFFGPLYGYPHEILIRVSKLARAIRFTSLEPKQVRKVRNAAVTPYGGSDLGIKRCAKLAKAGFDALRLFRSEYQPNYADPGLQFQKAWKTYHSLSGSMPVTERQLAPALITYLRDRDLQSLGMEPCFHPFTKEWVHRLSQLVPATGNPYVGCIGATQEGGGKLRMFAAPYTCYQHALYPIHYWIADTFNRNVKQICTWDQKSGAEWAQAQLRLGHVVHSVDLSTATCRWPLAPQLALMAHAGLPKQQRDLLYKVSRGKWRILPDLVEGFGVDHLQWAVGQPLGIAPSMSMFTLTHACVLAGLADELDLQPTFRVLGDDVLIVGDELYNAYINLLSEMDVPISYNKSHSSTVVAEFAGYTVTADTMVRPGQWRPVHKGNALAIAEELGVPTPGEVSILQKELQEFHLFRCGRLVPPSELLPRFIRMLLLYVDGLVTFPSITGAQLLKHRALSIARDAADVVRREFGLPYDPFSIGVRILSGQSPESATYNTIFEPLRPWKDDDVVRHFRHTTQWLGEGNHALIVHNAFTAAFSLWERQCCKDHELLDLVNGIKSSYLSLLDVHPRKSGWTELNGLYERYIRIHSQVSKDPYFSYGEIEALAMLDAAELPSVDYEMAM